MDDQRNIKDLLTQTVLNNANALKRFAFSLCQNDFESEELVAETVVKAFENAQQIKDHNKIKQWLFRILNNQFISNYRKKQRHKNIELPDDTNREADLSFSLFKQISESDFVDAGTPEKKFISKITHEKIMESINALPEEFRIAVVLCDIEEFSYAEIAGITAIPIGTVRSRIARARNQLQRELWVYAQELGIKKSKKDREKEYVCICGKEVIESSIIISE